MQLQKKNFIWNMIGASTNAFNSLFFIIIATRINGVDDAGIFSYAFATACILYVVGTYIIRAYQVTDVSGIYTDADYIYNRIISCAVMILLAILFTVIKQYDQYKSGIIILMCLFKCTEAFAEVLYGIMQKNGFLYRVGISMTMKALTSVIVFGMIDYVTENMMISSVAVVLVNLFFIFVYDFKVIKSFAINIRKCSFNNIRKLFVYGFYTFMITVLGLYLINAPRYAIDDMLDNSAQTIFGIIIIPATFMGLLGQYIIQPLLKDISKNIEDKQYNSLKNIVVKILSAMLVLGVLVFICAYLLEEPVLSFVYGLELSMYKTHMLIIIAGAVMYGMQVLISYVLISMRKTGVQVIVFSAVSVAAYFISAICVRNYNIIGASITYAVSMTLTAICLFSVLVFVLLKFKKSCEMGN